MKKDDTSDFTFFPACLARTPTPRPLIATVAVRKNAVSTHERLLDEVAVSKSRLSTHGRLLDEADVSKSLSTHGGRGGLP